MVVTGGFSPAGGGAWLIYRAAFVIVVAVSAVDHKWPVASATLPENSGVRFVRVDCLFWACRLAQPRPRRRRRDSRHRFSLATLRPQRANIRGQNHGNARPASSDTARFLRLSFERRRRRALPLFWPNVCPNRPEVAVRRDVIRLWDTEMCRLAIAIYWATNESLFLCVLQPEISYVTPYFAIAAETTSGPAHRGGDPDHYITGRKTLPVRTAVEELSLASFGTAHAAALTVTAGSGLHLARSTGSFGARGAFRTARWFRTLNL